MEESSAEKPKEIDTGPGKSEASGYERFAHGDTPPSPKGDGVADSKETVELGGGESKGYVDKPLAEFRRNYPDEYLEPGTTPKPIEPFGDPQEIADKVNPKHEEGAAYQTNCADVSRAVENNWRGREEIAAGRAQEVGEDYQRMEEWHGEPMHKVEKMDDVKSKLTEAGPGSSVIIETGFVYPNGRNGDGHAFNIVNKEGGIKVIDGQHRGVYDYKDGPGHPLMGDTYDTYAMGWDGEGKALWRD